jgi:hypothetical protein
MFIKMFRKYSISQQADSQFLAFLRVSNNGGEKIGLGANN